MTTEKLYHQEGEEVREYTEAEYAQNAKDIADALKAETIKAEAEAQAAIDKAALLAKLGLTADELKTLLS